jgi:hypothetical protein
MGKRPRLGLVMSGLCMGLLTTGHIGAATVSYSGILTADDQVQIFPYTLAEATNVIISTASYGGGMVNESTVMPGGFVPVLSLFDSAGTVIGSDGGGATCHAGMSADPGTGICDDAYLNKTLAAGNYTLAISEFFNVPVGPNLSDGFLMQGQGNFTGSTCGTTGGFYQTDIAPCVQRSNNFAIAATATPEPSTLGLGALSLILFGVARRRSGKNQN